jgi:hypothetical protein
MLLTVAFTVSAQPVRTTHTELNCDVTEVIITSSPAASTSVQNRRRLDFWLDDQSKTLAFSDGRRLRVTRFDETSIRADRDDIQYDFNRGDDTLTYAGSTTERETTRITVGSGHCAATPLKR